LNREYLDEDDEDFEDDED
jgi:hypothetical protein